MRREAYVFFIIAILTQAALARDADPLPKLLDAIRQVESGGQRHPPDGDDGRAIGPFQIWHDYWFDATHDVRGRRTYPGDYQDCRNRQYAEAIVRRYWRRYAPGVTDFKTLAALHHLGPGWRDKPEAAEAYWQKVKAALAAKE